MGFKKAVFIPSIIFILILVSVALTLPTYMKSTLDSAKLFSFTHFSWLYILCVSFFVFFMILLALSKYGDIKLGNDNSKPSFSFGSWLAMLFATGMGVGLMYFGVAEPIIHQNILNASNEEAMLHTIFHWGIHPWAIYGVCALAMAYFGFRYKMPLSLRSAFYPFLKDKINGFWGNIIDILALVVTIFGVSTTLGYSATQLNAGLIKLGVLEHSSFYEQVIIIAVIISLSTLSAISGLGKGLKVLSELNLVLAICLMIFVLFANDCVAILSSFTSNLGTYFSNIIKLSFNTYIYKSSYVDWFNNWTIFYWAWWLSWAPFVGFFIAKISYGRSIREFIFGVLLVPTCFNILWFSVFGNLALNINVSGVLNNYLPEELLFEFLNHLPLSKISSFLALVILALFFITSADSAIFVLNSIASKNDNKNKIKSLFWGILLVVLASSLLYSGGLDAILAVTMLVALPFAILMVLMCFSLLKGLSVDEAYFSAKLSNASIYWSGHYWEDRLEQILKQPQKNDAKVFLDTTVSSAMNKLCNKLLENELVAYVKKDTNEIKLVIEKSFAKDFVYGVKIIKTSINKELLDDEKIPNMTSEYVYELRTFFFDERVGYDISLMRENEIVVDILKHYERYLSMLNISKNDILLKDF